MRIAIGCDHHGLKIKRAILALLVEQGHEYLDVGVHSDEAVDYPDVAKEVASTITSGAADQGILVGRMCMSANKVQGIRAALCGDADSARKARQHDDTNVLCLEGAMLGQGLALEIVNAYLASEFKGGQHTPMVGEIPALRQGREGAQTVEA